MGWRFRKSFKIAPGVRWNLGKRGSSVSLGGRGFTVNVGPRAVRRTISILGTGLSHTQNLSASNRSLPASSPPRPTATVPTTPDPPQSFRVTSVATERLTDSMAVAAVRAWAISRFPLVGRFLPGAVLGIDREPVSRTSVTYSIRSRRIVIRSEPIARKMRVSDSLPDSASFDPWQESIADGLANTRRLAACYDCQAEGKRRCDACGGSAIAPCDVCGGSGQLISGRSGKLIQCRSCRGEGQRRCACRDGIITCPTCNGKTSVTVWLEVEESDRIIDRDAGDPAFLSHPLTDGAVNVEQLIEWVGLPSDVPTTVSEIVGASELNYLPQERERVLSIVVRQFGSERVRVRYELAGVKGEAVVQAWDGRIEVDRADAPFTRLKSRLRVTWILALLGGFTLLTWFANRHEYYAQHQSAVLLGYLAGALAVTAPLVVAYLSRPSSRRTLVGLTGAVLPLIAVLFGQATLIARTQPSLEAAKAFRESGNLEAALRESRAASDLGIDVEGARRMHDDVQIDKLRAQQDPLAAWKWLAAAPFLTQEGRRQAEEAAVEMTSTFTGRLQEQGQDRRSLLMLAAVPAPFQNAPVLRARAQNAHVHEARAAWTTIASKAALTTRLSACEAIEPPLEALGRDVKSVGVSAEQIRRTCEGVRAAELKRQKQAAAAARAAQLTAERAERQTARRANAAASAWSIAPLLCRDGSLSPSCVCGGSRRGCCSHHGGVAGCSK